MYHLSECKGKSVLVCGMEAYGFRAPLILNLGLWMGMRGQLDTLATLPVEKSHGCTLDRSLGASQCQCECFGVQKNFLPLIIST